MSFCRNLLGIIGLSALMLGLQGCSTVRLAYNQAPLVVDWYLNDYVDFNAAQKPALKSALEQVHVWHGKPNCQLTSRPCKKCSASSQNP